jgi:hypothetical protein
VRSRRAGTSRGAANSFAQGGGEMNRVDAFQLADGDGAVENDDGDLAAELGPEQAADPGGQACVVGEDENFRGGVARGRGGHGAGTLVATGPGGSPDKARFPLLHFCDVSARDDDPNEAARPGSLALAARHALRRELSAPGFGRR